MEEGLRRCCVATTLLDYLCRSCLICLRTNRSRAEVESAYLILREDGRYEHIHGNAWNVENYFLDQLLNAGVNFEITEISYVILHGTGICTLVSTDDQVPAVEDDQVPDVEDDQGPAVEDDQGPAVEDDQGPAVEDDQGPAVEDDQGPAVEDDQGPAVEDDQVQVVEDDQVQDVEDDQVQAGEDVAMAGEGEVPSAFYEVQPYAVEPNEVHPNDGQYDNEELLIAEEPFIIEDNVVQNVSYVDLHEIEVLDNAAQRIQDWREDLNPHIERRNNLLGRRAVLCDLIARQQGRYMREIDMLTMVHNAIPNGFDITQLRVRIF